MCDTRLGANMFSAKIIVKFKKNVKNPEAKTLETLLSRIDLPQISNVNCAKLYEIKIDANSKNEAQKTATYLAQQVLCNPIIEDFEVTITDE